MLHDLAESVPSFAQPLAAAGIPVFAIPTYATDYLLIPHSRLDPSLHALQGAGRVTKTATTLP
jgi:hypothetical protein